MKKGRNLKGKTNPAKESSQPFSTNVLLFYSTELMLQLSAEGGTAASQETLISPARPMHYLSLQRVAGRGAHKTSTGTIGSGEEMVGLHQALWGKISLCIHLNIGRQCQ